MMIKKCQCILAAAVAACTFQPVVAQDAVQVNVHIENIAPANGVAITPVWVGFHSGSFDSYNGGLTALTGVERIAEDGNASLLSHQFNNFNAQRGGYTYVDTTGDTARSALVRTGDLSDFNRQDATLGTAPLRPGQSASQSFELLNDGSNDFFSYVSMVLPTNDFFIANGNPLAHDIGDLLANGGSTSFLIGTPNGGVNDAGTEVEDFNASAGNGLFPNRNLPAGQPAPNRGRVTRDPITNVVGNPYANFFLLSRESAAIVQAERRFVLRVASVLRRFRGLPGVNEYLSSLFAQLQALEDSLTIDVSGLDFNKYDGGIARVTITAAPIAD